MMDTRITSDQAKKLASIAIDTAVKAVKVYFDANYFSKKFAEQVNSNTDKFENEEVTSTYSYLSGYAPKGLTEQCNRLRELFPGIGSPNLDLLTQIEKGDVLLPASAEGWFAIPNWTANSDIFGSTYSDALLKVLDTIKQTRNGKFYNYRDGQLNEKRLRQSARTQKFFMKLADDQSNPDILIVPAQFGLLHRGRSVRRARDSFTRNEFGLGALQVGIMILTHPERIMNYDDLWIDCAGDEFDGPNDNVRFDRTSSFGCDGDEVRFAAGWVGNASGHCGSVSGFLPL